MSKQTVNKGGKMPVNAKDVAEESDFAMDDLDFNILRLDPELKKEFEEKGYVPRWINATSYKNGGNFHKSGWRAYRRTEGADVGAADFNFGVSPEGYIIRNDLLLAFRPKELNDRWAANIRRKTAIASGGDTTRAEQLRESARQHGVKAKILDGYDENGD